MPKLISVESCSIMIYEQGFLECLYSKRGLLMYPEVINKMAFSKEHKDLLLKLYNKEITRKEYDYLVKGLYRPSKEPVVIEE